MLARDICLGRGRLGRTLEDFIFCSNMNIEATCARSAVSVSTCVTSATVLRTYDPEQIHGVRGAVALQRIRGLKLD